jgi:hypothetical protein
MPRISSIAVNISRLWAVFLHFAMYGLHFHGLIIAKPQIIRIEHNPFISPSPFLMLVATSQKTA